MKKSALQIARASYQPKLPKALKGQVSIKEGTPTESVADQAEIKKLFPMALSFHLVKRPDMRKDAAEGSKLFYAQVRSLKKLDFNKLCDLIAVRSTAFIGDVMLVIEGLLSVMEERLEEGDVIQMGRLGNFRMVAGSKGSSTEKDFNSSLFNRAHIVFYPGTMLMDIVRDASYEKWVIPGCDSGSGSGSGGGSDRPEIE